MDKHTPGPWVVWCGDDSCAEDDCGHRTRKAHRIGTNGDSGGVHATCSTTLADARLIAAAPDLLAVCKQLIAVEAIGKRRRGDSPVCGYCNGNPCEAACYQM